MSEYPELRKDLFPSGYCVDPEDTHPEADVEVFAAIDEGRATARQLLLAKKACSSCVQFDHCSTQSEEIAVELWRRGAGLTVVGGEQFKVKAVDHSSSIELPATFTFDLAKIPDDPVLALSVMRQGWRAGQLLVTGPPSEGAKTVRTRFLNRLKTTDPTLFAQAQEVLGEEETNRSVQFMATAIFQQKDFRDFSAKKRKSSLSAKPRYDAESFDMQESADLMSLFLAETIAIKQLGIHKPANKATLFGVDFYKKLIDHYKTDSIGWADFNNILTNNRRDPIAAFERREAKAAAIRDGNPGESESYVRIAARSAKQNNTRATVVSEVAKRYEGTDSVTEGLIRTVAVSTPEKATKIIDSIVERAEALRQAFGEDHPVLRESDFMQFAKNYRTLQGCADAISTFIKNVEHLRTTYADNPDMSEGRIRRFSQGYANNPEAAAQKYLSDLSKLRAHSDGQLTNAQLQAAAIQGISSYSEAQRLVLTRRMNDRFKKRVIHTGEEVPATTIVRHIATIYPAEEIESVAEIVYRLTNNGYVTTTYGESQKLTGEIDEDLRKIFNAQREYLTFSRVFGQLSAPERIAFAAQHGLGPIMYGVEIEPEAAMFLLERSETLDEYYTSVLEPACQQLVEANQTDAALPLSIIQEDLRTLKHTISPSFEAPERQYASLRGIGGVTLVVGGYALYLFDPETVNTPHDKPADAWLEHKVANVFPPQAQGSALERTRDALQAGTIEIQGDSPANYRLVFSKAIRNSNITDLERAVIANSLGIDALLYSADLTDVLRHRLGDRVLTVSIERHHQPEIIELSDDELAKRAADELQQEIEQEWAAISSRPLTFVVEKGLRMSLRDTLSADQRAMIADALMAAFAKHIEHPRYRTEMPGYEAQVYLAWQYIRGQGLRTAVNQFNIATEDVNTFLQEGVRKITEIVEQIPRHQLTSVVSLIAPPDTTKTPEATATRTKRTSSTSATARTPRKTRVPKEEAVSSDKTEGHTSKSTPTDDLDADHTIDIVGKYLREISKIPLLTAAEEVELAQVIEAGVLAHERLDARDFSLGTQSELEQLVRLGDAAKKRMIEANLRLVVRWVRGQAKTGGHMQLGDFIDEGNIGLIRAVEKFDYKKGYKFSTYATWWIKQAVFRSQADQEDAIRLPVHAYELSRKIRRISREYYAEHGVEITTEELVERSDATVVQVEAVLATIRAKPASLHTPIGDEDSAEFGDLIYDENAVDPGEIVTEAWSHYKVRQVITEVLSTSKRFRRAGQILMLRYGVELGKEVTGETFIRDYNIVPDKLYSLDQIAEIYGITRAAISKYQKYGFEVLRRPDVKQRLAEAMRES